MQHGKQENHTMVLEKSRTSGEEEWYCPECGRRMLVHWAPKFKRVVVEQGDEYALHSGSKSGLGPEGQLIMGSMHTNAEESGSAEGYGDADEQGISIPKDLETDDSKEISAEDDPTLVPWQLWMEKVDFDQLWNQRG